MERRKEKNNCTQKLRQALSETFLEFRDYSSIHGVKYMFVSNGPIWCRIMWTTSFTMALVCSTFMVIHSLNEFDSDPVMHTIEAYHSQLSDFPFPAVTICNENRFLISRARHFLDSLKMPPSTEINRPTVYKALHLLAALSSSNIPNINVDLEAGIILQDVLDHNNVTIKEAYKQLYQSCSDLLERCRWENQNMACSELFEHRLTFQGYCCSFNYALNSQKRPRRSFHYGAGAGLTLLVNVASHDIMPGTAVSLGSKVIMHHNNDFPDLGTERARCGISQEWLVNLNIVQQQHEDTLRTLSVGQRQCMFDDEAETFYNRLPYSMQNCQMVCRMEKTYDMCGCVAFYLPNAVAKGRRICNLRDLRCISDNRVQLESAWDCLCYQACTKVQFFHNIHSGNLKASRFHLHDSFFTGANMTERTVLHIYIGSQLTTLIRTSVSYSLYALMALLGGYCSLFLGCSLLSGLEIVYFSSIRLIRRLKSQTESWKPRHQLILRRRCPLKANAVNKAVVNVLETRSLQSQNGLLP